MKNKKYFMFGAAALCVGLLSGCQSEVMGTRDYVPADGQTGGMVVDSAVVDPVQPGRQGQAVQTVQPVAAPVETIEPMEATQSQPITSPVKQGGKKGSKGSAAMAGETSAAGTYVVQSGDYPEKIARKHGISTAALMQANNLTEDTAKKLRVGQKLVIPGKTAGVAVKGGSTAPAATGTAPAATSKAVTNADGTYTVQAGDFPEKIARKLGVKRTDLMKANGLTEETAKKLQVGQKLVVPGKGVKVQAAPVTPKPVVVVTETQVGDGLTEVIRDTRVDTPQGTEVLVTDEIVTGDLTTEILAADTTLEALAAKHKTTGAKIRELNPGTISEDGKLTQGMILLVQPNVK